MKIKRLPPDVAMRIAAGEVVERPVSVVKELMENSLDAGARRISVWAVQGGRVSLVVEDDGRGIDKEDLTLAVESHATSKISSLEDLEVIGTLGYRGEALSSIAAVSRLDIRSRTESSPEGGWIKAEGGQVSSQGAQNCKVGTRVQVDDLFFNLPARRKFLKTPVAEMRRISRLIQDYSVAYPEVAFALYSDDKLTYSTSGSSDRKSVLERLWGGEPEIRFSTVGRGCYTVTLWWQEAPRTSRMSLMAFVNGRRIDEPTIKAAIASSETNSSGNWAAWIETPPEEVDVNVHPAKTEVLFRHGGDLFASVRDCAMSIRGDKKPSIPYSPEPPKAPRVPVHDRGSLFTRLEPLKLAPSPRVSQVTKELPVHRELPRPEGPKDEDVAFLGQLTSGYLLFDSRGDLVIMDPHAAHERINFERIRGSMIDGARSQRLAVELPLPPSLQGDCEEHLDRLQSLGFDFSRSQGVMALSHIPDIPGGADISPLVLLRSSLVGMDGDRVVREVIWLKWATMACKASVKLTGKISPGEAMALWRGLDENTVAACPHGRPATIRMSPGDMASRFERS